MNAKVLGLFVLIALAFTLNLAATLATSNVGITNMDIYLNGHFVGNDETFAVERGNTLTIRTVFEVGQTSNLTHSANDNVSYEVRVKAWIDGYREKIEAETERFDIYNGRTYTKTLLLYLPDDIEEGSYTLHVMITSNQVIPGESYKTINLAVQRSSYNVGILSVDVALPSVVNAGENLEVNTVVKNMGSHKLSDVYVKAEVPELGLARTIYIGDLYPYDYSDNTERDTRALTFNLQIPENAQSGTYTLKVTAYNNDASAQAIQNFDVVGIKKEEGRPELSVVALQNTKKVKPGDNVSFTLVLNNLGNDTKTVTLNVVGLEGWATGSFDNQVIVLPMGSIKIATLSLEINPSALEGKHIFSVQVLSQGNIVATQNLVVDVTSKEKGTFKKADNLWMWVTVIVLGIVALVLLIMLIVLIVGRVKETKEKPEEIYY